MVLPSIQEALVAKVVKHLDSGKGGVLLKAGQRSGKTTIAREVITRSKCKIIIIASKSASFAESTYGDLDASKSRLVYTDYESIQLAAEHYPDAAVVIDECFWGCTHAMYAKVCKTHKVFAFGSRGPNYNQEEGWKLEPAYAFNCWDLNPTVTLLDLMAQRSFSDPKVIRDYCAF